MSEKIRMTLLIDQRSHPELYADLAGIDGDRNRTERVRYLAGIGLILGQRGPALAAPASTPAPVRRTTSGGSPRTAASLAPGKATPNLAGPQPPSAAESVTPPAPAPAAVAAPPSEEDASAKTARAARQMAAAGLFGRPSGPRG